MKSAAAASSSPGPVKGHGRTTATTAATTTEAVSNNNNNNNAQYVYETLGDAASALEVLNKRAAATSSGVDNSHNIALLTYLLSLASNTESEGISNHGDGDNNSDNETFQNKLLELFTKEETGEENSNGQDNGGEKRRKGGQCEGGDPSIQKLVLGHNLALNYLITNKPEEGVFILLPLFKSFSVKTEGHKHDEHRDTFEAGDIKCKVAFLLLDCILASYKVESVNPILKWIESFISWAVANNNSNDNTDESIVSSLKFRLHCYKSRGLFLQSKYDKKQSVSEANTRVAKKELKSAMEIYHHKLATKQGTYHRRGSCVGGDEGASVQESVALSIGSMSNDALQDAPATTTTSVQSADGTGENSPQDRTLFQTKRLYRQNQCALYLKANLEHLKGNTKKSLKLCSEAQHCGVRQRNNTLDQKYIEDLQLSSDVQSAYHFNNLAIIHQAAGKLHLAMHYYSRSLGHVERAEKQVTSMIVEKDGVVSPVPLSQILFNASLCAQQLSNFPLAHECMRRCVEHSPSSFGKDPFCWLHMGESCINSHVTLKRKSRRINGTR